MVCTGKGGRVNFDPNEVPGLTKNRPCRSIPRHVGNGAKMHFWKHAAHLACLALALGAATPAGANLALETQTFVERVITDINGSARRVLVPADRIAPGDSLVFVVAWRNTGRRPVRGGALTNGIPGRVLIDAADPAMDVSIDGGRRWGRLDQLWLPTPLGGTRRATAQDVTHVRWPVPATIAPGQGGRISYRGIVR